MAAPESRLTVGQDERTTWSGRFAALQREFRQRADGCHEAALAYLTLLLVDVSRLAKDIVADLRLNNEPLLAEVFGVIEERYVEPISLRDVADAVHLTPGYLTTLVRERTGRTVQAWIAERRMAEARRLLVETDLAVEEVGARAGFRDPGYFVRSFRRARHHAAGLAPRRARVAQPRGKPRYPRRDVQPMPCCTVRGDWARPRPPRAGATGEPTCQPHPGFRQGCQGPP
jgi:AraC-like DNA-binding protein